MALLYQCRMLSAVRVVLVRPRRGGNVGSVARAMKNMGLADLVLVAPRTRVGRVGERMAAHARDVLDRRRVGSDLGRAIADCHLVVGTVGRATTGPDAPIDPRAAARRIVAAAATGRVALVFGPEDHGLSNSELGLCQLLVQIPTAPDYPSLNLAQAVVVLAYELRLAILGAADGAGRGGAPRSAASRKAAPVPAGGAAPGGSRRGSTGADDRRPAASRDREALIAHLGRALGEIGFLSRQNPEHIVRDVRSLFARAGLTARDVRIWRGIARQVLWAAGRRGTARSAGPTER